MRLRSKLIITVGVQALSVIATALVSVVVAHRYGPEGQGYLSRFRSLVDFLMSVGLFGFPQAFVYMLNNGIVSPAWTIRFSVRYSALMGLIGALASALIAWSHWRPIAGFGAGTYFALVAGSSLMVLHGLYRSVGLATRSVVVFNLMSIIPAVAILAVYVSWRPGDYRNLVVANAIAGGVSAAFGFTVLRVLGSKKERDGLSPAATRTLMSYGFWAWIPGIAVTAQSAGSFALLRLADPSEASSGFFSAAIFFFSAMVLPLNMAAPVLFDLWSKRRADTGVIEMHQQMSHFLTALVLLVAVPIGWVLLGPAVPLLFGARFATAVPAARLLLLAALPACQNRLAFPVLLSAGLARSVALANLLRALPPLAIMWFSIRVVDPVRSSAIAWGVGECLCLVVCGVALAKLSGESALSVVGLSPAWVRARPWLARRTGDTPALPNTNERPRNE